MTKNRILILAAGAVLLGLWGLRHYNESKLYKDSGGLHQADETPQVKVVKLRPQYISGALKRIGTIKARTETNLQFGASGRLAKFDVEKGQFVKKGAVVAMLNQEEARNAFTAMELEYEKASMKYFNDRTIDRMEFERVKARYNQARMERDKTVIRAPSNGYLVEKWVNVGEQVDPGTVIGKLMDKSSVFVEMDLSEDDIQHLKLGQKAAVTVDAVPDFKGEGRVASITPYLKGDARSFNVKVDLPENPGEALNPGMFARCAVRRYEKTGALVVPVEAGAEMKEKEIKLFTVDAQNKAHVHLLPVLFMGDGLVEISGLSEGDLVVLRPPPDLDEGRTVQVAGVMDTASVSTPAAGSH